MFLQLIKLLFHSHLPLQVRLFELQKSLFDLDVNTLRINFGSPISVAYFFDVLVDLQP